MRGPATGLLQFLRDIGDPGRGFMQTIDGYAWHHPGPGLERVRVNVRDNRPLPVAADFTRVVSGVNTHVDITLKGTIE